jgi:Zn finger protein HypA/HybF involved in hydrogenase expression
MKNIIRCWKCNMPFTTKGVGRQTCPCCGSRLIAISATGIVRYIDIKNTKVEK